MDYSDLFRFVALFGHGVFTINMLEFEHLRIPLRMFIKRNPQFFHSFKGEPGELNVYALTKEGRDHFRLKFQATRSMSYEAHVDMAVINAFLIQYDLPIKYSYGPKFRMEFEGKTLSLFSLRWGLPKNIHEIDGLLMRKSQHKNLNDEFLLKLAADANISTDHLKSIFSNSYFPLN